MVLLDQPSTGWVSLRAAADKAGNRMTQTVVHTYGLKKQPSASLRSEPRRDPCLPRQASELHRRTLVRLADCQRVRGHGHPTKVVRSNLASYATSLSLTRQTAADVRSWVCADVAHGWSERSRRACRSVIGTVCSGGQEVADVVAH